MSAIKYVGRTLWKVYIRYDHESGYGRDADTLWIATKSPHVKCGVRTTENLLFRNKDYPNSDIVSIERMGQLDA